MNKSFKPFFIVLIVAATVVGYNFVQPMLQAKERIAWRTDLAAATAESRTTNKPLFLYFTATWCGPCQSLKHTTWADPQVEKALDAYVPVKIDIDEHPDLARQYRADAIPEFVIASQDGSVVRQETGALDSETFLKWLSGKAI